jgi:hypothetical protein
MASKKKLDYPELRDIPRVSLAEARRQITLSMKYNQRRGCIVLVGESGLGKTQVFNQIAREEGYKVMPIHTAHWGLMGSGIPMKPDNNDFFKVALPDIFPKPGDRAIVLFDELNRGLKHAIAMFFTMLEDGRMFNYELPDECLVCGTMNPATAAYAVTQIENEAAIRRRVKFLYVQTEVKGWITYASSPAFHADSKSRAAKDRPCHPGVLSYFRSKPKNIYDQKALDEGKQYTCPAVIETISEDVYNMEAENIGLDDDFALHRIAASMGMSMGMELAAHLADSSVTLSADDALYRVKSIKNKLKKLGDNVTGKSEILVELSQNVLKLLFADAPPVETIGDSFIEFCTLLPQEVASPMLQRMHHEAEAAGQKAYLFALMRQLQTNKQWKKLHLAINADHNEVQDEVTR